MQLVLHMYETYWKHTLLSNNIFPFILFPQHLNRRVIGVFLWKFYSLIFYFPSPSTLPPILPPTKIHVFPDCKFYTCVLQIFIHCLLVLYIFCNVTKPKYVLYASECFHNVQMYYHFSYLRTVFCDPCLNIYEIIISLKIP